MDLLLPIEKAEQYTSPSQRIRVMSECWVREAIFCPNCGKSLSNIQNDQPGADFFCQGCAEEFELNSKKGEIGKKIAIGEYSSMVERLRANKSPNFFFLTYDSTLTVQDFLAIPRYFFTPSILEKSTSARRECGAGCALLLESIPDMGKIFFVHSGGVLRKEVVLAKWKQTGFIKETSNLEAKSWLLDILCCVDKIKRKEFSLEDVYQFEADLKRKHPQNSNIQAKIFQQLQILRDEGALDFLGSGRYRLRVRTE